METFLIRIHPHLPQRGYRAQRYSIYGYLFIEADGWYQAKFRPEQWEYLRSLRNSETDPNSPPIFQIVDEAGRMAIEEAERQIKIRELAPVLKTVDLTTRDLRHNSASEEIERRRSDRAAAYDERDGVVRAPTAETAHAPVTRRGRGRPKKAAAVAAVDEGAPAAGTSVTKA